jgi:hypothetical protein
LFIRSQSPLGTLYGDDGEIICAAKTKLEWETKAFATRQVDIANDFKWCYDGDERRAGTADQAKFQELYTFALHVYRTLRQRHDAYQCY